MRSMKEKEKIIVAISMGCALSWFEYIVIQSCITRADRLRNKKLLLRGGSRLR